MSGHALTLRRMAWVVLAAGIVGAILLWISARETVEVTRSVIGHARLTFEDVEIRWSVARIAAGVGSLALGAFLWALGRVVADLADRPD